jgi:predicted transport protein
MSLRAVSHYECLARGKTDTSITPALSNQLTGQAQPETARVSRGQTAARPLSPRQVREQLAKSTPGSLRSQSSTFVSFEDHVAYADPEIRPVLRELRGKLKGLGGGAGRVSEKVTKHQRVAYSVAQIFAELKVQKKRVLIRFFGTNLPDPRGLVTSIPATHRWQHDKEIAVDSPDLVNYTMTFVQASYRSNRSTLPAR